ncbi:hypothetical protein JCM5296_002177, partial [Sporobolomyces johnsonii]
KLSDPSVTISDRSSLSDPLSIPSGHNAGSASPTVTHHSSSSSSTTDSIPPPPPPIRRSLRGIRDPTYGPSDLDSFVTAQRSLRDSSRSAMSGPPQEPDLDPTSPPPPPPPDPSSQPQPPFPQTTDPPPAPPQAPGSNVGSTRSRREEVEERYQADFERLAAEQEAQRDALKQRYAGSIAQAKLESVAAGSDVGSANWRGEEDDEAEERLRREVLVAREALEEKERVLEYRRALKGQGGILKKEPSLVADAPRGFAKLSYRYKPKEPKAWTGEFDYIKRETWIKTALGHVATYEFDPHALLDEHLTPAPFYLLRNLFSPETSANNKLSPQNWFDARHKRAPFKTAMDVFEAVRLHWSDDHASERAWSKYRSARQGSSRDF